MDWKKICRACLFPPAAVLAVLLPLSGAGLSYSFLRLEETDPVRLGAYVVAFYTLLVWCLRMPRILAGCRRFRRENRYARRWLGDVRLRVKVTLWGSALFNSAYALMQLAMGIYHGSSWFYALAAYYCSLALMRLGLVRHTAQHGPGENMARELRRYRGCGWIFLLTNLSLSAMIFYMIYENRLVQHHEITTIAMAAYTFAALTLAIVNVVKYRKYQSPVYSASKAISLAAACVSMLTLEDTMLRTFRNETMTPQVERLFLALSGGAVSLFIITMAVYMIVKANEKLNNLEITNEASRDL